MLQAKNLFKCNLSCCKPILIKLAKPNELWYFQLFLPPYKQ